MEPLSIHFKHWLVSKTIFQKSVIFMIIRGIRPTSRQTQRNFENIRAYKAVCFGATQCNNSPLPFFKPKYTFFTSTNAIFNTITYAHFFNIF